MADREQRREAIIQGVLDITGLRAGADLLHAEAVADAVLARLAVLGEGTEYEPGAAGVPVPKEGTDGPA